MSDIPSVAPTHRRLTRGVSLRALAVVPRKLAAWWERRRQRRMVERLKARIAEARERKESAE